MPRDTTKAIAAAARSGNINLTNWGLTEVPAGVLATAEPPSRSRDVVIDFSAPSADAGWWEVVELHTLTLAHNSLGTLPEAVGTLQSLTLLDVSNNKLTHLPESLRELASLKSLDVSHNNLTALPAIPLPTLVRLRCTHNQLRTLPPSLSACSSLSHLELADNRLEQLPAELAQLHRLARLDVKSNQLVSLDSALVGSARSLTELDVSRNQLRRLPTLAPLRRVVRLELTGNRLEELPADLGSMAGLVELHVGENRLRTLPSSVGQLAALRTLDLRANAVATLPGEVCGLTLSLLDLTNNELTALPPKLGTMTTLRRLVLDGNPLRSLPHSVLAGPISKLLESLRKKLPEDDARGNAAPAVRSGNVFGEDERRHAVAAAQRVASAAAPSTLSLAGTKLSEVPAEVWEAAANLAGLDLSNNSLQQLPADHLVLCRNLRVLDASRNRLTVWPLPPQCVLPALEQLTLAHNPIRGPLPPHALDGVGAALRSLDLSGIADAPPEHLSHLQGLVTLRLQRCQLSRFPESILSLRSLRALDVRDNRITALPSAVTSLTALEQLDVTNNDLAELPSELGLMAPTLSSLMVEGNCLKSIRRPILDRGTPAVLEYLRNRLPS